MAVSVFDGPAESAAARLAEKTPIGAAIRSADWAAKVPTALRDRAFFSAGVTHTRWLAGAQRDLLMGLRGIREQLASGKTANVDRSSWIGKMRAQVLGLRAAGELPTPELQEIGELTDLASRARLKLIYQTQWESAHGFQRWADGQDEDLLDAFPAQELIRIRDSRVERPWPTRWAAAGGRIVDGRMVALKNDAIWQRLSRFDLPYPPFDYNSGMGVRDVGRAEAIRLGLLREGQTVAPIQREFNAGLEAEAAAIPPELRAELAGIFGDQIDVRGDVVKWRAA